MRAKPQSVNILISNPAQLRAAPIGTTGQCASRPAAVEDKNIRRSVKLMHHLVRPNDLGGCTYYWNGGTKICPTYLQLSPRIVSINYIFRPNPPREFIRHFGGIFPAAAAAARAGGGGGDDVYSYPPGCVFFSALWGSSSRDGRGGREGGGDGGEKTRTAPPPDARGRPVLLPTFLSCRRPEKGAGTKKSVRLITRMPPPPRWMGFVSSRLSSSHTARLR